MQEVFNSVGVFLSDTGCVLEQSTETGGALSLNRGGHSQTRSPPSGELHTCRALELDCDLVTELKINTRDDHRRNT